MRASQPFFKIHGNAFYCCFLSKDAKNKQIFKKYVFPDNYFVFLLGRCLFKELVVPCQGSSEASLNLTDICHFVTLPYYQRPIGVDNQQSWVNAGSNYWESMRRKQGCKWSTFAFYTVSYIFLHITHYEATFPHDK